MNYIAHLLLAEPNVEHRIGSLLADFTVGTIDTMRERFGENIAAGILHHREIDRFTDTNPMVLNAIDAIKDDFGLYSGIVTDVVFDHYLLRHWPRYTHLSIESFLDSVYQTLAFAVSDKNVYPSQFMQVVERLIAKRWLASYLLIENVGVALKRVGERFSHQTPLENALPGILANYETLETCFLAFFPKLVTFSEAYLDDKRPSYTEFSMDSRALSHS